MSSREQKLAEALRRYLLPQAASLFQPPPGPRPPPTPRYYTIADFHKPHARIQ